VRRTGHKITLTTYAAPGEGAGLGESDLVHRANCIRACRWRHLAPAAYTNPGPRPLAANCSGARGAGRL